MVQLERGSKRVTARVSAALKEHSAVAVRHSQELSISIALIADTLDTEGNVFSSWAFALGAGVTLIFVAPLTSNAPTGPNRVHPNDAHLTEREFHELRRVEFDSPTVRERALIGVVLAAAVIGLRNVAYGMWFFSAR